MTGWCLGLLVLCAYGCSSGSSSSGNTYTPPQCADSKFYCPKTRNCLPRSERCTGDIDAAATGNDLCKQKNYRKCDYSKSTRKFKAKLCSTPLHSRSKRGLFDFFRCLKYKKEHQFVTYRGLMYEFGDYGTRVQDPLDPNYEYRPGGRPVIRCTGGSTK